MPADMVLDIMACTGHRARAKGLWALGSSRSSRTWRAGEQGSALGSEPGSDRVYVSQHLSSALAGKATRGRPRSEPDWGKPTVRDRRGACGNVDQGGTRTPPRLSKERVLETLRLQLCAPQIYPDRIARMEEDSICRGVGRLACQRSRP